MRSLWQPPLVVEITAELVDATELYGPRGEKRRTKLDLQRRLRDTEDKQYKAMYRITKAEMIAECHKKNVEYWKDQLVKRRKWTEEEAKRRIADLHHQLTDQEILADPARIKAMLEERWNRGGCYSHSSYVGWGVHHGELCTTGFKRCNDGALFRLRAKLRLLIQKGRAMAAQSLLDETLRKKNSEDQERQNTYS